MTDQPKRWAEFGYEPVRGLANRHISRYLRTQRKNMRRFFQERGLYTLLDRMNQIRNSRQGMLAKNLMFQKVLNDYAKLSSPPVVTHHVPGVPEGAGEPAQGIVISEAGSP
jgi:hypothetical protein